MPSGHWYRSDMLPNLASRARSLAPLGTLGLATLGTLVLFAANTPEPRAESQPQKARQHRVGRCGAAQVKVERRLVEHAITAKTGQLEACIGTRPFDLVVTSRIARGGLTLETIVSGTGSAATSRCFLSVLEEVEFPPITRPLMVRTRLHLEAGELVVDTTARR
jgi:hypothetical protein